MNTGIDNKKRIKDNIYDVTCECSSDYDKLSEVYNYIEELDKLNKEYYGFTMKEIDDDLGTWMARYTNIKEENKKLKLELSGYRQAILNDDKLLGLQQELENKTKILNELKDWLKTRWGNGSESISFRESFLDTLNKLEELEKDSD